MRPTARQRLKRDFATSRTNIMLHEGKKVEGPGPAAASMKKVSPPRPTKNPWVSIFLPSHDGKQQHHNHHGVKKAALSKNPNFDLYLETIAELERQMNAWMSRLKDSFTVQSLSLILNFIHTPLNTFIKECEMGTFMSLTKELEIFMNWLNATGSIEAKDYRDIMESWWWQSMRSRRSLSNPREVSTLEQTHKEWFESDVKLASTRQENIFRQKFKPTFHNIWSRIKEELDDRSFVDSDVKDAREMIHAFEQSLNTYRLALSASYQGIRLLTIEIPKLFRELLAINNKAALLRPQDVSASHCFYKLQVQDVLDKFRARWVFAQIYFFAMIQNRKEAAAANQQLSKQDALLYSWVYTLQKLLFWLDSRHLVTMEETRANNFHKFFKDTGISLEQHGQKKTQRNSSSSSSSTKKSYESEYKKVTNIINKEVACSKIEDLYLLNSWPLQSLCSNKTREDYKRVFQFGLSKDQLSELITTIRNHDLTSEVWKYAASPELYFQPNEESKFPIQGVITSKDAEKFNERKDIAPLIKLHKPFMVETTEDQEQDETELEKKREINAYAASKILKQIVELQQQYTAFRATLRPKLQRLKRLD